MPSTRRVPHPLEGEVYEAPGGARMAVVEVEGDFCLMEHVPNPHASRPRWRVGYDVATEFALVGDVPEPEDR